MCGKKKKLIEELETELEQLIANSGRSEDDIHNDYIAYCAPKRKIDNPDSRHNNDDIWQMNDLNDVFLLGMAICRKQNKINAACKVAAVTAAAATAAAATAAAAAAAAAIATSNVANTSISSSASTLINGNKITASFESTPPPSFDPSTTSSLPSSNDHQLSVQPVVYSCFTLHKQNHCQL
jgi:hypothetical protein